MKQRILFVCLGNICRSPAAEAVFNALLEKEHLTEAFEVDSAGTYAGHTGEPADRRMRRAASARGIEIPHRARQIRSVDFERFDHIIVMDDYNYEDVHRLAPSREGANKIYRMREFFTSTRYHYVPDPYYEGREGFEIVLDLLEEGCSRLLDELTATQA